MYGGIGVSASSLHRESTDSLIGAWEGLHKGFFLGVETGGGGGGGLLFKSVWHGTSF